MVDLTSWWVFTQKNGQKILFALYSILIFLVGWQLGRVMSPYYQSQPIVFQDRQCEECASSGGTTQELEELQAASMTSPTPDIAGTMTNGQGQFVASKNSNLYHHISCPSAHQIKPENQRWFATVEEARAAGLTPSKCSQELGY